MKRIALMVIVVSTLILVTACGSSTPAATQVPILQPDAGEAPAQSTVTEALSTGTEVIITLDDNTIESSLTTFQVGVPYTFVITNKGSHSHNFNIAQPVSVTGGLNAALKTALLAVPKSQLGGGAEVTVQYTFPDTAASTQLELSCLIQRHYDDGMKLAITVTN
ncbi:MAG: hypothetical protein HY863_14025 [Chloroflexi bacterium]|nr:hypothetical protein [Chloroflexota bacterium]